VEITRLIEPGKVSAALGLFAGMMILANIILPDAFPT
jgi:hypothetical protein